MTSILFIQPYLGPEMSLVVPLGIGYLGKYLKDRHVDVDILDLNLFPNPWDILKKKISNSSYDYISISLRNIDSLMWDSYENYYELFRKLICIISERKSNETLLIGGAGFSIFLTEIMSEFDVLNYGMISDDCETLYNLIVHNCNRELLPGIVYRKNNRIIINPLKEEYNLSKLPKDPWSILPMSSYVKSSFAVGVITKLGCELNCSYCTYPHISGRHFRSRPVDDIIDDLELLQNKYQAKTIYLIDSVFNYPRNYAETICHEIIRRNVSIQWASAWDLSSFDEDLLNLAYKSGCIAFSFSPDGFTNSTMRKMGKKCSVIHLNENIRLFKKYPQIPVSYNFFMNPIGIKNIEYVSLLVYYHRIKKMKNASFNIWLMRILPHTPLFKHALKKHYLTPSTSLIPETGKHGLNHLFWLHFDNSFSKYIHNLIYTHLKNSESKNYLSKEKYKTSISVGLK